MDFALPEIGEGVYEAELVSWLVNVGDTVKPGQNLLEVLTDKATMEVPAPFGGTVTELRARPGQPVKVGEVILSYTPVGQPVAAAAGPAPAPPAAAPPPAPNGNGPDRARGRLPVKAAPSVRYLARKLGIDLAAVRGTGPQGRVLLDDLGARLRPGGEADGKPRAAEPKPDYGTPGTRIKLQGLRRRIAEHMALATRTIPHYTYVDECDVTELVRLRESLRESFAAAGVKLTYLAFVVKAVAEALQEVPLVNSSLDEAAGEIVLHDRYQVGIAVATPAGLIVPVVRDADRKNLAAVAREIDRLSGAARAGKARLEDLRGGTFTVTSVGNIGGLFSTPVINHPEAAILGVGKVVRRPVFDANGQVRPADMVYLSLSFDHRLIDGAVGAAFANAVLRRLQSPALLLLPPQL
ncbi:MAG TPA: dihydrolipoamide acetyltransferase family protein [Gemmataceae bacterium]|jgi:pyruvate dehydrogenase E2 component (dihydrolipoamide acetyltransferase)/2-oxoisovalerate dehydrogenase E2 component (dihydrolipoyl transacylase)|nr:dihydrolipoamide acetyltransferase family protein [Gemmataceae bacterium]